MGENACFECGVRPGKYYMIHPEWGRPVRVWASCEALLAEQIAARRRQHAAGTPRRLYVVASARKMPTRHPTDGDLAAADTRGSAAQGG